MAQFLDGVNIGFWGSSNNTMYGTLNGTVSRSGNTVTLSGMTLKITSRYTSTGSGTIWFEVNGTRTSIYVNAGSGTTNLGTHNLNNTSFGVTTTQTSKDVSWLSSDSKSGSFTVTFPSGATVPNTPTNSLVGYGAGSITVSYGTDSFGTAGAGTVRLYMATTSNFSDEIEIDSKTTTGQSSYTKTGLTHRNSYYFRSRATSTVGNSSYSTTLGPIVPNPAVKIYGSVAGKTKMVLIPYGSVAGKTKKITKIYASVNGKTKLIFN